MNFIYDATNEETARVVENYPWGFRFRTKQRYWVESTKNGQRFVSQTMNPKTGKWCKEKKSVYFDLVVMTENEGRYNFVHCSKRDKLSDAVTFIETHKEGFCEFQKKQAKIILAFLKVMEKVTWEVRTGDDVRSEEETQKTHDQIRKAIAREYHATII